jgi:hypothetical protein
MRVSEARYEIEFEDTFDDDVLSERRWVPFYLPHWSSRERAAARYEVGGGQLRLLIESDQEPWCPELDGEVRVSSLQTGVFAGPVGSKFGQHRFSPDAFVREAQEEPTAVHPALRSHRDASQGHRRPALHGGSVDDRLRG